MNKKLIIMTIGLVWLLANLAQAAGKITGINFSGPDDGDHPNVVQIQIEGGFSSGTCDTGFAAIRVTEERKHLIGFVLAAYAAGKPVNVVLNGNDRYYGQRCTIARISSVY